MELIARLPSPPHALLELDGQRLVLAFSDGLAVVEGGALEVAARGPLDSAARGPDGGIYCTRGAQILRFEADLRGGPADLTASFAGTPQGRRRVVCAPDGELWVEGGGARRRVDGTFHPVPDCPVAGLAPAPWAADIHGNLWSLVDGPGGAQVLVLPANTPAAWQLGWLEAGRWEHLVTDSVGGVWVAGPDGWRALCPRRLQASWRTLGDGLPAGPVTAVGTSPDGLVLAAFASGELLELDTDAAGNLVVRPRATLPGAGRCLLTDREGAVWVATDDALYHRPPAPGAWQHTWSEHRGRLPGGGNHDIFAAEARGRIYVAGGWAGQWGLPPCAHVADELVAFDPRTGYWEVAGRMPMPRRYNGIAELEGRIWVVGGETRTAGRAGEGQALYLVDIYDPASGSWSPGPSLNEVRTDPFVVTCNGRLYAIGGASHNSGPKLSSVESIGAGETTWRFEPSLPEPTRQGHACVLDGVVYCASIDGVYAYDTASGRWDADLPQPGPIGQGPLAAAYRGEVWLMGGYEDRTIRCFDPRARTWRPGPDLPTEQAWAAAIVAEGRLYVIGGAHRSRPHDAIVFDDRTYVLRDGR